MYVWSLKYPKDQHPLFSRECMFDFIQIQNIVNDIVRDFTEFWIIYRVNALGTWDNKVQSYHSINYGSRKSTVNK